MGYAVPQEDNPYKPAKPPVGGGFEDNPAIGLPTPSNTTIDWSQLAVGDEFGSYLDQRAMQPQETVQPIFEPPPTMAPAALTTATTDQTLGKGGRQLVPMEDTTGSGMDEGTQGGSASSGIGNVADLPSELGGGFDDRGSGGTGLANDIARGLNDLMGVPSETYSGRGGPGRGGDVDTAGTMTTRLNQDSWDSGYALAQQMDEAGYKPGDINVQNAAGRDASFAAGMARYWAQKDEGGGPELDPTAVEEAVASGNESWFNLKGDTLEGLGEGYEVAYNKDTGEFYIKNWNEDDPASTWERWDGADVPNPKDLFDYDEEGNITGVKPEFQGGTGTASDIRTDNPFIQEVLTKAGNPSEETLKAWAKRMDEGKDASERDPNKPEWWYGILAKELGYTTTYHRPYTTPPNDFYDLLAQYGVSEDKFR